MCLRWLSRKKFPGGSEAGNWWLPKGIIFNFQQKIGIGQKTGQYGVCCDVIGYGSHLLSVASCYAVKTAFSGVKDKCIGYPLRAVKKALIYGLLS